MKNDRSLLWWFVVSLILVFLIGYAVVLLMGGESVSREDTSRFVSDWLGFRLIVYSLLTASCFLWARQTRKAESEKDSPEEREAFSLRAKGIQTIAWKVPVLLGLYEILFAQKLWM
ncbi:hypothetical protein DOK_11826 [gamma proteobacterium BDW918]|nr:hypothetical protein DOK_11826 [gamma proteobacterium BDW918]